MLIGYLHSVGVPVGVHSEVGHRTQAAVSQEGRPRDVQQLELRQKELSKKIITYMIMSLVQCSPTSANEVRLTGRDYLDRREMLSPRDKVRRLSGHLMSNSVYLGSFFTPFRCN